MNKKLNWKYIKSRKVWRTVGHYRELQISNMEGAFILQWYGGKMKLLNRNEEVIQPIHTFKEFKKAKRVAQLIYEG